MTVVAIAIGGSAVVGAAATVYGAKKSASSQKEAASTASNTELEMYYQSREDTAPWREAGEYALNRLTQGTPGTTTEGYWLYPDGSKVSGTPEQKPGPYGNNFIKNTMYGAARTGQNILDVAGMVKGVDVDSSGWQQWADKYPGIDRGGEPTWIPGTTTGGSPPLLEGPGDFEASPGYEFVKSEGMKAINNALSSKGRLDSGRAVKEAARYVTGLASQEYGNFWNRYQDKVRGYQNLAGIGQNVATNNANNALATGQNIAGYQAAGITGAGNAYAAGAQGVSSAINQGIGNYMWYKDNKA